VALVQRRRKALDGDHINFRFSAKRTAAVFQLTEAIRRIPALLAKQLKCGPLQEIFFGIICGSR
jgi:hypothetical protein